MKPLITSLRKAPTPLSSPLPPSPPPSPCPWLWRCHSCYTIYRLAVTRRCLDCDHTFCLGDSNTTSPQPKGKKRKRGGPCKAEFDYAGWHARGAWRRTVLLNGGAGCHNTTTAAPKGNKTKNWGDEHRASAADEVRFEDKRERLFVRRRHDCSVHCDFPSECHHALFRAQKMGLPILREAEALDAAEEAVRREAERQQQRREREEGGGRPAGRLTADEYKRRRAAGERHSGRAASSASRFVEDLPVVVDGPGGDDDVSPCSPTSPDPPGDLMREVSPVDNDDGEQQPLSPGSRRRASLLVTTDTPVDFATTAAPLNFDDTYSDDDEDDDDEQLAADEERRRRTKSRRKIAQLTGEGLESFGPFVLNTTSAAPTSPTSPLAATATAPGEPRADDDDLRAAYSEQAWFSPQPTPSGQPQSPKSPERAGKRDRMFALLGRRSSSSSSSSGSHPQQHQPQQASDATAVAGEEWESWSDSSSSSTSSTASAASLLSSSSIQGRAGVIDDDGTEEDKDGDVPMRDDAAAAAPPPAKDDADEEEGLRALLRMRNAFMRGEMI